VIRRVRVRKAEFEVTEFLALVEYVLARLAVLDTGVGEYGGEGVLEDGGGV